MCIVCAGGPSDGGGVAAGMGAPPSFNLAQIIAQLDRNERWWLNGDVTFSFFNALGSGNAANADYAGFQTFTAAQKAANSSPIGRGSPEVST